MSAFGGASAKKAKSGGAKMAAGVRKKSPFESSQGPRRPSLAGGSVSAKAARSETGGASGTTTTTTTKKKKKKTTTSPTKNDLRSVQDQRKAKDAKLKALSSRIAWLQAEEERASAKVTELHSLIEEAGEKAEEGVRDPSEFSKDIKFRGVLSQKGKEQVLLTKRRVKEVAKEHKKGAKELRKDIKRTDRVRKKLLNATTAASSSCRGGGEDDFDGQSAPKSVHKIPGSSKLQRPGQGEAAEVEECLGHEDAPPLPRDKGSHSENKFPPSQSADVSTKKTLSALELISQRWRDDKQPLRENVAITRKHIISQNSKRGSIFGGAKRGGPEGEAWGVGGEAVNIFEYSAGAWKKERSVNVA
ncbi:hypothetical protein A3770_12p66850 [Chloropicon primus]|uniref:Uncharacterized protein n=1 Tax=Chloropicon primus TaxID=1764295 RepID=A0A5B8MUY6_9CHLO|nr:hypothetical protein A3770_12p66850 [Chloropicon primus]|eukprot:QDZ24167.1 hypothetical protein A3770_12p66850 [Chloropicon primus]